MQRLGVGAGWRSQTASPGAQRCAEGPPEPYPYHLFIDSVPRSHSGAAYRSWHGRERGCGGKEASPRLRGSPRLFNCAGSAGRAQPGPGGRTGVCVCGGDGTRGRCCRLATLHPCPEHPSPSALIGRGRGGGSTGAPPRMLRPGTATCRILKKPGAGRASTEQPGEQRQFRALYHSPPAFSLPAGLINLLLLYISQKKNVCMYECMEEWVDGWVDRWIDG